MTRVCVVGAGNGALATAGDLSSRGLRVTVLEHPDFAESISGLQRTRELTVEVDPTLSIRTGKVKLASVTTSPETAIEGSDLIIVVVPSFASASMAALCVPYLSPGQKVVLSPGNLMSLEWKNALEETGTSGVVLGESSCMIYSARRIGDSTVFIRGYKEGMSAAALDATQNDELIEALRNVYPDIVPAKNIIDAALQNVNPIYHPAITLLNMGRIESTGGDFLFYREGSTPGVCRIMERVDIERMNVGKAFGLDLMPISELTRRWYLHQGEIPGRTIYDMHQGVVPYKYSKAPSGLSSRLLTEDIPYGLVTWCQLGEIGRVETPTMSALVHLAEIGADLDLSAHMSPVEKTGWLSLSCNEILKELGGKP